MLCRPSAQEQSLEKAAQDPGWQAGSSSKHMLRFHNLLGDCQRTCAHSRTTCETPGSPACCRSSWTAVGHSHLLGKQSLILILSLKPPRPDEPMLNRKSDEGTANLQQLPCHNAFGNVLVHTIRRLPLGHHSTDPKHVSWLSRARFALTWRAPLSHSQASASTCTCVVCQITG